MTLLAHPAFAADVDEKFYFFRENGVSVMKLEGRYTAFIEGKITRRTQKSFARALKSYPAIDRLGLNSPGGDIDAAFEIADAVHARDMETQVPAKAICNSACSFIFLAGTRRWCFGDLGVHQIIYLGRDTIRVAEAQREFSRIVGILSGYGVSPGILKLMFETPNDKIHVLSMNELVLFGVMNIFQAEKAREVRERQAERFVLPRSKPNTSTTALQLKRPPGFDNGNGPERALDLPEEYRKRQRKKTAAAPPAKSAPQARQPAARKSAGKTRKEAEAGPPYYADWSAVRGHRVALGVKSRRKRLSGRVIFWPGRDGDAAAYTSIDILFNDTFAPESVAGIGRAVFWVGNTRMGTLIGPVVRIKPGAFRQVVATSNLARPQNCHMIKFASWIEVPIYLKNGEQDTFMVHGILQGRDTLSHFCDDPS